MGDARIDRPPERAWAELHAALEPADDLIAREQSAVSPATSVILRYGTSSSAEPDNELVDERSAAVALHGEIEPTVVCLVDVRGEPIRARLRPREPDQCDRGAGKRASRRAERWYRAEEVAQLQRAQHGNPFRRRILE